MSARGLWRVMAVVAASVLAATPSAVAGESRSFGDARVLAVVPNPPGFPEGIAVRGNTVYVAGPATFGTTSRPPSRVVAFDISSGDPVATYDAKGEDTSTEHANSSIAFDGNGRLYVLNTQLGIYRLALGSGEQQRYSQPFPDLAPCSRTTTTSCSPTPHDAPPIPNDIAFDAAGNAYVTDSMQATIWRVSAVPDASGARRPQIWFQDARLASEYIGVNGLRFNPERTHLYLTVSTDLTGRSLVYTLRMPAIDGVAPGPADLQPFYEYLPGELPDGIAFGRSGRLYVAIALPGRSGVSILEQVPPGGAPAPKGIESIRLSNPPGSPFHPYDSPANIAFTTSGSILLTNHAFVSGAAVPSQFTVLDVFVGDKGSPLEKPLLP